MSKEYVELKKSYESIKNKIPYTPRWGVILGSGLGDFVENLKTDAEINYKDIKNFPKPTNIAHKGKYIFTKINKENVVVMSGRIHFYEGYEMKDVVKTIRLMKLMGVEILIITNAAGGTNKKYNPGDLMLIEDHIALFIKNPLIGENVEELGIRFPDMSEVYDKKLKKAVKAAATKHKIRMQRGVYAQLSGPSYETGVEALLLSKLGTDAVGMSTVVEAITARHAGMRVVGISVITNLTAPFTKELQSDEDVLKMAKKSSNNIYKILKEIIK